MPIYKKSRSKAKECALYLAISPKKKNDRVVNYIEVIKKDASTKLSKKNQLSKKVIKGDKIRIYWNLT